MLRGAFHNPDLQGHERLPKGSDMEAGPWWWVRLTIWRLDKNVPGREKTWPRGKTERIVGSQGKSVHLEPSTFSLLQSLWSKFYFFYRSYFEPVFCLFGRLVAWSVGWSIHPFLMKPCSLWLLLLSLLDEHHSCTHFPMLRSSEPTFLHCLSPISYFLAREFVLKCKPGHVNSPT